MWTAKDDNWNLRNFIDYFNQRLIERALREENFQTPDGELLKTI